MLDKLQAFKAEKTNEQNDEKIENNDESETNHQAK